MEVLPNNQVHQQATGRASRVVSWLGWHAGELAGIAISAVLGLAFSGWLLFPGIFTAVMWGIAEMKHARDHKSAAAPSVEPVRAGADEWKVSA